ncbi:hypothetical protein ACIRQH_34735 [Streptomyces sp. NPDC102279]|uniref:hypothetical protein n=1 Tax=Streptomyces sp. NPDC102279 TaxID=3366153 RepID=UPI00381F82FD
MNHTHSLAEWAESLLLALSIYSAGSALVFLICDADLADFDPRRLWARLVESGRLDPLLIDLANARLAVRDAVLDAAALVLLLTTSPKGAMG